MILPTIITVQDFHHRYGHDGKSYNVGIRMVILYYGEIQVGDVVDDNNNTVVVTVTMIPLPRRRQLLLGYDTISPVRMRGPYYGRIGI
jgi:hypothetical protein